MTTKQLSNSLLVAYADGELGPDDIALVEAAIATDPHIKARVDTFKKSGSMLKASFESSDQVTPDHVIHRFKVIEAAAKKKQQIKTATVDEPSKLSWRFFGSLGGSFAAGLACAVFIISPALLTVNNEVSFPSPAPQTQQLVMRGVDQFMVPYVKQLGVEIAHGESIQSGKPFEVVYKSPILGRLKISEISDNTIPIIRAFMSILDLDVTEYLDVEIDAGVYEYSKFTLEDQESLHFRIEFSNDVTTITHDIVFKVTQ